jgi:tripartite-type tricarboxylate transporter receptor subunit TctC
MFARRVATSIALLSGGAAVLAGCATQSDTGGAAAEQYPSEQIQYVIPFDPGGESDVTARIQQQPLERALGEDVVVTNRPAGGGAVAWSELATDTTADGHTITGANLPHILLQPLAREDAGFETSDIKWAYIFESTPNALLVAKESPYDTLEEFTAAAKKQELSVGGSSSFSANHMGTLALNEEAGINLTYVPFDGTADGSPALLGGQIDAFMSYNTEALDLQDQGAKVLAVASEQRLPELPDAPTFKEQGYDVVDGAWRGVAVPPDTPDEIVDKVAEAFAKVNQDPQVRQRMEKLGFHLEDMGPAESADFTQQQLREARQLLKRFDLLEQ